MIVQTKARPILEGEPFYEFVDLVPFSVLVVDTDLVIHVANRAALALFGRCREDAIGRSLESVLPGQTRSDLVESPVHMVRRVDLSRFGSTRAGCHEGFVSVLDASGNARILRAVASFFTLGSRELTLLCLLQQGYAHGLAARISAARGRGPSQAHPWDTAETFKSLMASVLGAIRIVRASVPSNDYVKDALEIAETAAFEAAEVADRLPGEDAGAGAALGRGRSPGSPTEAADLVGTVRHRRRPRRALAPDET